MATATEVERLYALANLADEELDTHEVFWRDLYPFLMDHGYQLRPRFRPGWIPSWKGTNERSMFFEDSHGLLVRFSALYSPLSVVNLVSAPKNH